MNLQAMTMRPVPEQPVVVVDGQVADRLAEIVEKAVADRPALDDANVFGLRERGGHE